MHTDEGVKLTYVKMKYFQWGVRKEYKLLTISCFVNTLFDVVSKLITSRKEIQEMRATKVKLEAEVSSCMNSLNFVVSHTLYLSQNGLYEVGVVS